MEIHRAKTAGFCWGVDLALRKLEKSLKQNTTSCRLIMFGPIIHNPQALKEYRDQGVLCVNTLEEIQPGDIVIIRAHGIPIHEETYLQSIHVSFIDATCPKVKKAQLAIADTTTPETHLLLFGEEEHPEVRGLVSYAKGPYTIFDTKEYIEQLNLPKNIPITLASQTTQDSLLFEEIQKILQKKTSQLTTLNTICDATHKRQEEALSLTKHVEAMVVVGGFTSGNTRRLAEISKNKGVKTWHIETVESLQTDELKQFNNIGLTAGASTPKKNIDEVESFLNNI